MRIWRHLEATVRKKSNKQPKRPNTDKKVTLPRHKHRGTYTMDKGLATPTYLGSDLAH
jgi:hypothetical protein